ncbi:MAG TPA: hypothetical protein VF641_01690 [Methylobacterium sp.]|jgi:hypothetical protein
METVLILAAIVAVAISVVAVTRTMARARRPPLRLPHEEAIEDDDGQTIDSFAPPPESPIDRSGRVLDLEPVEPPRKVDRRDGAGR